MLSDWQGLQGSGRLGIGYHVMYWGRGSVFQLAGFIFQICKWSGAVWMWLLLLSTTLVANLS